VQKIGRLSKKEEWLVADPTGRIVASGGERLLVFDVAARKLITVVLTSGEWEGFAAVPGDTTLFLVGRERKTSRDLHRVVIPADL
jgi:hypothetical protein